MSKLGKQTGAPSVRFRTRTDGKKYVHTNITRLWGESRSLCVRRLAKRLNGRATVITKGDQLICTLDERITDRRRRTAIQAVIREVRRALKEAVWQMYTPSGRDKSGRSAYNTRGRRRSADQKLAFQF